MDENELAVFQEQLLDILASAEDGERILSRLKDADYGDDIAQYIESFNPEMVAVAATLVKKWGKRTSIPDH